MLKKSLNFLFFVKAEREVKTLVKLTSNGLSKLTPFTLPPDNWQKESRSLKFNTDVSKMTEKGPCATHGFLPHCPIFLVCLIPFIVK